jgi:flagellar export protein FliJ
MKPFRFSLESLRVLRKQKEHAAQLKYARALTACDRAALQLQNAATELAAAWHLFTKELAAGVTAGKLAGLRTWCMVLEIRRNERRAALEEARRAAEQAFQAMIVFAREREALDRFHDKSLRAHEHAAQCEEQKQFDELAVQSNGAAGPLQFAGHLN